MGNIAITIAFSNPPIGCNRLVFGGSKHAGEHMWGAHDGGKNTGQCVRDQMENHHYKPFIVVLTVSGKRLEFDLQCTECTTNVCTIKTHGIVCRAAQENGARANGVSILTGIAKLRFSCIHIAP